MVFDMDTGGDRHWRNSCFHVTGSLTLFADGLDSLADALVSFIVWFGIKMLQKPTSTIFHFGYSKIESIAAFVAAVVIVVLGSFIVYHA
ncbi:MAG: cation transporter, partial [Nitrososphaerales archaeon]